MQKYTAIILASRDANEVNRLYIMYTLEQGLVKAVAKGVRKPAAKLAGHLEPGTLSEVYVAKARGMGQITGAITLEIFENIKKDFGKLAEALKIFRFFVKNFSEGEKDERIFGLLRDFLSLTNRKETAQSLVLGAEAFWWKLFNALGNRPEVMKCLGCEEKLRGQSPIQKIQPLDQGSTFLPPMLRRGSPKPDFKFFSAPKGGIVCASCSPNFKELIPISDNQIKLLRIFWGNSLEKTAKVKVSKAEIEKLAKIREVYIRYYFT